MKKKNKQQANNIEANDNSFWDIEKTFESKVHKPTVTFGKNNPSRLRGLRSNRSNAAVNIFSTIKKSSLIIKPKDNQTQNEEKEATKDKAQSKKAKKQTRKRSLSIKSEDLKESSPPSPRLVNNSSKSPRPKELEHKEVEDKISENETSPVRKQADNEPAVKMIETPVTAIVDESNKPQHIEESSSISSSLKTNILSKKRPSDVIIEDTTVSEPLMSSDESSKPSTVCS